ncbi:MAG: hypothetical protein RMI94_01295 [Bryobacterales bacterium]|nr:hypothetical protein [Bryobacteraceae bacterium]MDW8129157.1 hypothetical protein [Bryobacterales bacterium]
MGRLAACSLLIVALGFCQNYSGPRPPKPDLPYLVHADNLVPTEVNEARQQTRGKQTIYTVPGAASPARTPVPEPIFLLLSEKILPETLELYRLEVKGGNRQIVFPERVKDQPRPLRLVVQRLDEKLYKLEVSERFGLENGAYALTPKGSNQVFCFDVY